MIPSVLAAFIVILMFVIIKGVIMIFDLDKGKLNISDAADHVKKTDEVQKAKQILFQHDEDQITEIKKQKFKTYFPGHNTGPNAVESTKTRDGIRVRAYDFYGVCTVCYDKCGQPRSKEAIEEIKRFRADNYDIYESQYVSMDVLFEHSTVLYKSPPRDVATVFGKTKCDGCLDLERELEIARARNVLNDAGYDYRKESL